MKVQHLYTDLARYYDFLVSRSVNTEIELQFLEKILSQNKVKSVLDVGCGSGRHSIPLAQKNYQVLGMDNSAELLELARSKAHSLNIQWIYGDAATATLPIKVDAAICMWSTINEMPIDAVAENLCKLIKPKGLLILDNSYIADHIRGKPKDTRFSIDVPEWGVVDVNIVDKVKSEQRTRSVSYKIGHNIINDDITSEVLSEDELESVMNAHGFTLSQIFYDYQSHKPESPRRFQTVFINNPLRKGHSKPDREQDHSA